LGESAASGEIRFVTESESRQLDERSAELTSPILTEEACLIQGEMDLSREYEENMRGSRRSLAETMLQCVDRRRATAPEENED
jgi:hypothetical protein